MDEKFFIKIREGRKGIVKSVDIQFPVFQGKNKSGYLAISPVLNAIGYSSESPEKAHEDLISDIEIFIKYHIKNSSLKKSLKSLGWKTFGYSNKKFESPVISIDKYKTASKESRKIDLMVA